MKDEYIRKQDAVNALDRIFDNVPMELTTEILRLRRELRGLPSTDVAPVTHGRWIDDGTEFGCQCSECGKSLDDYVAPTEYASLNEIPNFCPNCGAKMRGVQDE